MSNPVSAVDNLPPIDRLTVRLAEWARSMGHDMVDGLHVPTQEWVPPTRVGQPAKGDMPDGDADGQERPWPSRRDSYVQFVIDRASKEVTVRIIDRQSGEVIRTIPPEELLKMLHDVDTCSGTLLQASL